MKHFLAIALLSLPLQAAADWAPKPVNEADLWGCVADAGDGWHAGAVCIGRSAEACIEESGAHDSITVAQCLEAEAKGWDGVLNTAYQSLRTGLSGPEMLPVAAVALKDAQRAWIAFRDAECLSRGNLTTGTAHFEDGADCTLRVTATRALDLIGYGGTP